MGRGTLVPEHYVEHNSSLNDIALTSVIWGLSLGISLYTFETATRQTMKAHKRAHRITAYMVYVWSEWFASTAMGVIAWLFLKGIIRPSLEYFLAIIVLWCIQVHTLMQIIINRVAILSVQRRTITRLKWGTFFLIIAINIAVTAIWVPASLQLSPTFIKINEVFDRIQKTLLCLIDAALNGYFIYLVRSRLISNGLDKYTRLFRFNLFMIGFSITLDVLIVAMMSLPNKLVYLQFHPLAYLLKLQIELGMADLIVKVVRASNPNGHSSDRYKKYAMTPYDPENRTGPTKDKSGSASRKLNTWNSRQQHTAHVKIGDDIEALEMEGFGAGIKKTVVTEVVREDEEEGTTRNTSIGDHEFERESESSSTRRLKQGAAEMR